MSVEAIFNISNLITEYAGSRDTNCDQEDVISKKVHATLVDLFSNSTLETDYSPYILDRNLSIQSISNVGPRNVPMATFSDGSQWVVLTNPPFKDRFCGFLYLQNALQQEKMDRLKAAPNKMAVYDQDILYLSQYCGEQRLSMMDMIKYSNELDVLDKVGFTDTMGGCNLRIKDGKLFVFDTEKTSFDSRVHESIDAYGAIHDNITSSLET